MKIALVKNGAVVNTVRGNQQFANAVAADWDAVIVLADDHPVSPGWGAIGGAVLPPIVVAVVPSTITMRQFRLALLGAGFDAGAKGAINGLPPAKKAKAEIEWQFSDKLDRDGAFINLMVAELKITAAQMDAIFIAAAKL